MSHQLPTVPTVAIMLDKPRNMRFTFSEMGRFQKLTGINLLKQKDGRIFDDMEPGTVVALFWTCLVHEDPNLTQEHVGAHIHLGNLPTLLEKLTSLWTASVPEGNVPRPTVESGANN